MKKENNLYLGVSEPEKVNEYMAQLGHPMAAFMQSVREFILKVDKRIGEGIYWNAPTFYYTGAMEAFEPKTYKRYLLGFNLYRQDTLRLILLKGAGLSDPEGLLEGDYKDGRRIMSLKGAADLKAKGPALKHIIKQLLEQVN